MIPFIRKHSSNILIVSIFLICLFCMDVFPFKYVRNIDKEYSAVVWTPQTVTLETKKVHIKGKLINRLGRKKEFKGNVQVEGYDYSQQDSYELLLTLSKTNQRGLIGGTLNYTDLGTSTFTGIGKIYTDTSFSKIFIWPSNEGLKIYVAPANSVAEAYALIDRYTNIISNYNDYVAANLEQKP